MTSTPTRHSYTALSLSHAQGDRSHLTLRPDKKKKTGGPMHVLHSLPLDSMNLTNVSLLHLVRFNA